MILAVDLKNGTIFRNENGQVVQVLDCQHHRKSQAKAVVRVKLLNMETDAIIETSYRPEDKLDSVNVEKRKTTFLYSDGEGAHFMDSESYEQFSVPARKLGGAGRLLVENMEVEGLYLDEKFFTILMPANIIMEVVETVPGVKGDSANNVTKPAKIKSGIEIKVPLFINKGDKVKVDTRTLEYIERAK